MIFILFIINFGILNEFTRNLNRNLNFDVSCRGGGGGGGPGGRHDPGIVEAAVVGRRALGRGVRLGLFTGRLEFEEDGPDFLGSA
jgi:hypothetical protein